MAEPTILVKEYNVIWEALNHYEKYLEQMSLSAPSENEQLVFDEKLQDIDDARKTIQYGALNSYGLQLK
ncbi:hypothetical protein [Cellvibrio sp. UBA7661]|uniref:hypothetical protein n=1 Tax=Cellvibrio sp. UBA7661 TaxID=1946311 RepID=UPI002F354E51